MNKFNKITTALALICLSKFALADGYVGGSAGWSIPEQAPDIANTNSNTQTLTYDANLGYQYNFNKNFASGLEANYINFGQTGYSPDNSNGSSGSFKNSAIQLLVTGTYLMDSGVNTFIKAGVAHQTSDLSVTNTTADISSWVPDVAGGVGYFVLKNLNLYVQYQHEFGDNWANATTSGIPGKPVNMDTFTAGVTYLFPM